MMAALIFGAFGTVWSAIMLAYFELVSRWLRG